MGGRRKKKSVAFVRIQLLRDVRTVSENPIGKY